MDLEHIGFDQLLTFVRQLPDEKLATLKAALKISDHPAKKRISKDAFRALLLDGPVMGAEQFKTFKANRERFDLWRKK